MKNKNYIKKGYLLVDLVLSLFLISILFLGIGKSFSIYTNNKHYSKEKAKIIEVVNSLAMEAKHNLSFDFLKEIQSGTYALKISNIDTIINTNINKFLKDNLILNNDKETSLGWSINVNHVDDFQSNIKFIYKNEFPFISENEEVKIYKFLE